MKKLSLLLFVFLLALSLRAEDVRIDSIDYSLNAEDMTASVIGSAVGGDLVIPDTVVFNSQLYTVQSIGESAFSGRRDLTSITLPQTLRSIGSAAFNACFYLTSVNLPESVTHLGVDPFAACRSLSDPVFNSHIFAKLPLSYVGTYTVPDGITSIASGAFSYCTSLTSVVIPNSVTDVGAYAFRECTGLVSPVYNTHLFVCLPVSHLGAYTIPDGITAIATTGFTNCTGLTSVAFPNTLTTIGVPESPEFFSYIERLGAFSNCTELTSINLPESLRFIGYESFSNCDNLRSVVIPDSVTEIEGYGFSHCDSLKSVEFGRSLSSLGRFAFYGCESITSLVLPNSLKSMREDAFGQCTGLSSISWGASLDSIGIGAFIYCSGLASVEIPEYIKYVGNNAFHECTGLTSATFRCSADSSGYGIFSGCTSLRSVTLGDSVKSVEYRTFEGCSSLMDVRLGHSIRRIEAAAFSGCSALSSINIPSSVSSIGTRAFSYCTGLTSVRIPNSVDSMGSDVFSGCILDSVELESCTPFAISGGNAFRGNFNWAYFIVPFGSLSIYKTDAEWSRNRTFKEKYRVRIQSDVSDCSVLLDTVCEASSLTCTAVPSEGYHFTGWSDGYTDNPRILALCSDTTLTALFAKNIYSVTVVSANPGYGAAYGTDSVEYMTRHQLQAAPNTGYQFVGWSDGNTQAIHYIYPTSDTVMTAYFAKKRYAITVESSDLTEGTVYGDTLTEYLDTIFVGAIPDEGYHFTQWSDGYTENPRLLVVRKDAHFIAQFEINRYELSLTVNDRSMGTVSEGGEFDYMTLVECRAIPADGYEFVRWSDGSTDNPRMLTLTGDTALTAFFSISTFSINGTIYNYGDTATLTAPEVECQTFIGWSDGRTDNPLVFVVHADAEIQPLYSVNRYRILFADEQDNVYSADSVDCGVMPVFSGITPTKAADAQYSYTFAGWMPEIGTATADATYRATFTASVNSYIVRFLNYDGTTLQTDTLPYGAMPVYNGAAPMKPTTAQYTYTFNGWSPTLSAVTGEAAYVAQYDSVVNLYQITFVNYDGTTLHTDTLPYGAVPQYDGSIPVRSATEQYSYTFTRWLPALYAVEKNEVYHAQFEETVNTFMVAFVDYDGTVLLAEKVEYGHAATPPTNPVREGYTFTGWDPADFSFIRSNMTITAQYELINALDELQLSAPTEKILLDGLLYIRRGEHLYDSTGRLVE